jgi:gamma-glutamyltranspeptidase
MVPVIALLLMQSVTVEGARTPAFAPDGRIAVSVRGDLWILSAGNHSATRVTTGAAWDRDPAWLPDGGGLVYASDVAGTMDLWRIDVSGVSVSGEPRRLTFSEESDTEPSVGHDGTIYFVRGTSAAADLWKLKAGGGEERVTSEPGADRSPAASPTGDRLAWVSEREGALRIRLRDGAGQPRDLVTDMTPTRLSWSPDGSRLAFGSRGRRAGVWVTPADGRYVTIASDREGSPAWSPDGQWLAVAGESGDDVGYNGNPDRLGGRAAGDVNEGAGGLRRIRAPAEPDAEGEPIDLRLSVPATAHNADTFDRVWDRVARLYLGYRGGADTALTDELKRWRDSARRYRTRAIRAATTEQLDEVIHAMLQERPPARRAAEGRAGVSSAHPLATAAGTEILAAGGNVVDAAVAVSFALGVVEPDASGMGGYGEALIHLTGMAEPTAIEFMTRVPENANTENLLLRQLPPDGPMLANVPGVVAGMGAAWKKYGKLPWARLLAPAIRIAEQGFVLDDAFATTLRREWQSFAKYESSRALFFRNGRPLQAGDTLRNPDLARTLRQIAAEGADAFYRGSLAKTLVEDLSRGGNPITLRDMSLYYAAERRPVRTTYRDHTVYSGPPPVTGGVSLTSKLNLLELAEPGTSITNDAAKLHAMIEAWKLQPTAGGRVRDPDMWPVDVSPFESKDTARVRWTCFDPARLSGTPEGASGCRTTTPERAGRETDGAPDCEEQRPCRSTGTTAFAVADKDGNVVAVTQTLGTWGGNFYVTPGLGFLYNDKMVTPRGGGRGGGSAPLARVGTVIAPTLVFRGTGTNQTPLMALGAAGNAWITSAVYEMVVGVIDHDLGPQEALELPRFLPGGRDGPIQIEDAFSPAAMRQLEAIGHRFRPISLRGELRMGYGAAVMIRGEKVIAGADPRRSGAAGAVR